MNDRHKAMGLLAQLTRGLLRHSRAATAAQLGDRSKYVGMSDIGKGVECLRAAVAGKLNNAPPPSEEELLNRHSKQEYDRNHRTLRRQLTLQRGHWFEDGVRQAFTANGVSLIPQLEIHVMHEGVPIRAHLDFTLVWGWPHPAVRVLEIKSTEHIPQTLYASYETQVYGQLGLLNTYWDQPVFSVRDDSGQIVADHRTFPEIARQLFGARLPHSPESVDIEGWVLCLAMSDARAFGPYLPDPKMLALCQRTAAAIWGTAQEVRQKCSSLDDIAYCRGFHPLCDWCDHARSCPKFIGRDVSDPESEASLAALADLKTQRSHLESEISQHEQRLRTGYARMQGGGDWLNIGPYQLRVASTKGRSTLDREALTAALVTRLGNTDAQDVLASATRTGAPSERLYIRETT